MHSLYNLSTSVFLFAGVWLVFFIFCLSFWFLIHLFTLVFFCLIYLHLIFSLAAVYSFTSYVHFDLSHLVFLSRWKAQLWPYCWWTEICKYIIFKSAHTYYLQMYIYIYILIYIVVGHFWYQLGIGVLSINSTFFWKCWTNAIMQEGLSFGIFQWSYEVWIAMVGSFQNAVVQASCWSV